MNEINHNTNEKLGSSVLEDHKNDLATTKNNYNLIHIQNMNNFKAGYNIYEKNSRIPELVEYRQLIKKRNNEILKIKDSNKKIKKLIDEELINIINSQKKSTNTLLKESNSVIDNDNDDILTVCSDTFCEIDITKSDRVLIEDFFNNAK